MGAPDDRAGTTKRWFSRPIPCLCAARPCVPAPASEARDPLLNKGAAIEAPPAAPAAFGRELPNSRIAKQAVRQTRAGSVARQSQTMAKKAAEKDNEEETEKPAAAPAPAREPARRLRRVFAAALASRQSITQQTPGDANARA